MTTRVTHRRAFTLVEIMLASALAAIVAGTCFGVFAMMHRADRDSQARNEAIESMSRLHRTMQRACRTLLLDLPQQRPVGTPAPTSEVRPRVALTEDGSGMQRLELSLSQAPILGLIKGKPSDPVSRYQPTRGVFEIRPELHPRTGERTGLALWWVPLIQGSSEPIDGAEIKVASGMKKLDIQFAKTVEKRLELIRTSSFADWGQVPAYVQVEVEMNDGEKGRWMFEVSGITGSELAAQAADADMPAGLVQRYGGIALASASGDTSKPSGSTGGDTATAGTADGRTESGSGTGNTGTGSTGGTRGGGLTAEQRAQIAESIRRFYELLRQRDGGGDE